MDPKPKVMDLTRCEYCAAQLIWFDRFPLSHQGWWEFESSMSNAEGYLRSTWHPHTPERCRDVKNGYTDFAPAEKRTTLYNPDGPQPMVAQDRPDRKQIELALGGPGPYHLELDSERFKNYARKEQP
jgi:hypothetical protein